MEDELRLERDAKLGFTYAGIVGGLTSRASFRHSRAAYRQGVPPSLRMELTPNILRCSCVRWPRGRHRSALAT
jgi:hypothetical protein